MGYEIDRLTPEADAQYTAYIAVMVAAAIIATAFLPLAISHDPREATVEGEFPGTRRALFASLVVIACSFTYFTVASCVVFVSLASRRSPRWSALGVAALLPGVYVDPLLNPVSEFRFGDWENLAAWALLGLICLLIGMARGRKRERRLLRLAQLDSIRDDERRRIARDMHDSLSHRLSLIAVHAGALSYARPELNEAASTIRDQAEAAVNDLRTVLHALREDAVKDPSRGIQDLVDQARAHGTEVTVEGDIHQLSLPTVGAHTLFRAVQEGLTNARKHAPGQPVNVSTSERGNEVRLVVSTPVVGRTGDKAGFGLMGLKERAEIIGGSFRRLEGPGFAWELSIPKGK